MSLYINAMSCRVGKFKNLSSSYRIVKENITSGRKSYRICNSNICKNTEILQDYNLGLNCSLTWTKPLVGHIKSQLSITEPLTLTLKAISGILNPNNCKSLTEFNNSTDSADLSYHWSRVTYHLSKITFNSECELKLRLITAGYQDASMVECLIKLVALPDLGYIARELKKVKLKVIDENYISLLSTCVEYLEKAHFNLSSTLEMLQSYPIVSFDQLDVMLSLTKQRVPAGHADSCADKEKVSLTTQDPGPYFHRPKSRSKDHHLISSGTRFHASKHFQIIN